MANYTKLLEIELGLQSLTLEMRKYKTDSKYYSSTKLSKSLMYRIAYQDSKYNKVFYSLSKMGDFLVKKSISLQELAKSETHELAIMLCRFMGLGRVVIDHEIYFALKTNYGIEDLKKYEPSIESNTLTCLSYKPELGAPRPTLIQIEWNLTDLTYRECHRIEHIRR